MSVLRCLVAQYGGSYSNIKYSPASDWHRLDESETVGRGIVTFFNFALALIFTFNPFRVEANLEMKRQTLESLTTPMLKTTQI